MSKRRSSCKVNCTFLELWLRSRWPSQWNVIIRAFVIYMPGEIENTDSIFTSQPLSSSFPDLLNFGSALTKIGPRQRRWTWPLHRKTARFLQLCTPQPVAVGSAHVAPLKGFLLMSLMASILLELMGPFMSLSLLTSQWHLTLSATYFFLIFFFPSASVTSFSPVLFHTSSWTLFFKRLFLWILLKS